MSGRILPVVFIWCDVEIVDDDGVAERTKAMVPLKRYGNVCGRQYHDGSEYPLVPLEARSRASHSHYFAALNDGFDSLPEDLNIIAERLSLKTIPPGGWTDVEHFRKWCLCETNWCEVGEFDFDSKDEARKLAQFYRRQDGYAQIMVRGSHVTIKTAKSQSAAAMQKEPFEASKRDVLDLVETMLSVKKGTLKKQAAGGAR